MALQKRLFPRIVAGGDDRPRPVPLHFSTLVSWSRFTMGKSAKREESFYFILHRLYTMCDWYRKFRIEVLRDTDKYDGLRWLLGWLSIFADLPRHNLDSEFAYFLNVFERQSSTPFIADENGINIFMKNGNLQKGFQSIMNILNRSCFTLQPRVRRRCNLWSGSNWPLLR